MTVTTEMAGLILTVLSALLGLTIKVVRAMTRVENRLDTLFEDRDKLTKKHEDHDRRITELEHAHIARHGAIQTTPRRQGI